MGNFCFRSRLFGSVDSCGPAVIPCSPPQAAASDGARPDTLSVEKARLRPHCRSAAQQRGRAREARRNPAAGQEGFRTCASDICFAYVFVNGPGSAGAMALSANGGFRNGGFGNGGFRNGRRLPQQRRHHGGFKRNGSHASATYGEPARASSNPWPLESPAQAHQRRTASAPCGLLVRIASPTPSATSDLRTTATAQPQRPPSLPLPPPGGCERTLERVAEEPLFVSGDSPCSWLPLSRSTMRFAFIDDRHGPDRRVLEEARWWAGRCGSAVAADQTPW